MPLVGTIITPQALSDDARDRMFALLAANFEHVSREAFEADLAEKQWVVLLRDAQVGEIRGFSTLMLLTVEVEGEPIEAVFSGDTIVERDYWGESTLAGVWGAFVLSLAERRPERKLYWFLISKGYRTYKFLPVYFREYHPCVGSATPRFEQQLLSALAERKFPGRYDAASGVIRFDGEKDRLAPELAAVPEGRLRDPHIQFFLERNPGYAEGDELACVAEISAANFKPFALQVFARAAARLELAVG